MDANVGKTSSSNTSHRCMNNIRIEDRDEVELSNQSNFITHVEQVPNQLFDGANGENEDETNSTINNFECIEDLNLQVCDEEFEDYMHQEFEKLFTVIWGQDLANDMLILEEQPSPEDNFKSNIARWAVECKIPRTHLNKLLKILRLHPHLDYLPTDHRSILKSLRRVETIKLSPGKYYHFNLPNCLSRVLECVPQSVIPRKISIHVNVDGLPMCKSTNGAFWPILVKVQNLPYSVPFVSGLYYGPKKPDDFNEFLRRFIDESNYLECEGFYFNDQYFEFEVGAFICDTPATAEVKGTGSHTAYWSCNKCVTRGEREMNRTVFPELDA